MLANRHLGLRCYISVFFASVAAFCAGCGSGGPQIYQVTGKVVFKSDQSVARFGLIEFRSEAVDPPVIARGRIDQNGVFQLTTSGNEGAVAGWHTVVIQQVTGNLRGSGSVHHHGLEVAKKYIDHRTTDLRVEVKTEGDNQIELLVDAKDE